MRSGEEIIDRLIKEYDVTSIEDYNHIILIGMREYAEQAIDLCAEEAIADYNFIGNRDEESNIEVYVLEESILKVKEMLK